MMACAIGQWMSEDPLGFEAGDENLKRYVGNRSLIVSDPLGLWDWDGDWLQLGVGGLLGFYGEDVQAAAGRSVIDNPGRKVIEVVAEVDPTPIFPTADVVLNGTIERRSTGEMATEIVINALPGPPARIPGRRIRPDMPNSSPGISHSNPSGPTANNQGCSLVGGCGGDSKCFVAGTPVAVPIDSEAELFEPHLAGLVPIPFSGAAACDTEALLLEIRNCSVCEKDLGFPRLCHSQRVFFMRSRTLPLN